MNKDFMKWLIDESGISCSTIQIGIEKPNHYVSSDDIGRLIKYNKRYPDSVSWEFVNGCKELKLTLLQK